MSLSGQQGVEKRDSVYQSQGNRDLFRKSKALRQTIAGQKRGTGVVGKGKKVSSFFRRDTPFPNQICRNPGSCGVTAQESCQEAEGAIGRKSEESPGKRLDQTSDESDAVQDNQKPGQDKKRQQYRNQGVKPEQQSF